MRRQVLFVPALIFIVLMSWAVSSPVGSSPDDDFHLPSIWCANGSKEGVCQVYEGAVRVPSLIANASVCFRHRPYQSAACQERYPRTAGTPDTLTERFNDRLYPPLFYKVMNSLAGADIIYSTIGMRLINVFLFCLLGTALYALGNIGLRTSLAWMWLLCSVPMGMFLIASNNPSAWVIMGTGFLFGSLVGFLQSGDRLKVLFALLATVSCAMALGSRADGSVYVIVTLFVVGILAKRDKPKLAEVDTYLFLAMATAAAWMFFSSDQGQITVGGGLGAIGANREPWSVFWHNLVNLPLLWFGTLGIQALGWLDTFLPSTVYIGTCGAFFFLLAAHLKSMSVRKKLALLLILSAITVIPLWVLMQSLNVIPEHVQSRYLLPLLCLFGGALTFRENGHRAIPSKAIRIAIVGMLSIAHSTALYTNIRRYVTGLDLMNWNLNQNMEWWYWSLVSPMTVWCVSSVGFALMAYFLVENVSGELEGSAT